jgi:hypothetical protein
VDIKVLYFEGCPNHVPTVELVRQVVAKFGVEAEVEEVEITGPEDVEARRFLGSPIPYKSTVSILTRRHGNAQTIASVAECTAVPPVCHRRK